MGINSFYILSFGFTFSTLNFKFPSPMNQLTNEQIAHFTTNNEPQTTNHKPRIMQNEPNFQKSQMNVSSLITKDYENKWQRRVRKNKPNSNPIKPNLPDAQMSVNSILTKHYRKNVALSVRKNKPKTNPISEKPKNERKLFFTKGL
jgi:hypothetical protein